MLILALIMTITPGDLTGFWHSEPDLSHGYETCYFLWDTGEFAFVRSIEEGTVFLGTWLCTDEALILDGSNAIGFDGRPVKAKAERIALRLIPAGGEDAMINLGGEPFYLLDTDPMQAIISLIPTYGMTDSESDAFSTYD